MADMASFREKLFQISFYGAPYFGLITRTKGKVEGKLKCKYSIMLRSDFFNVLTVLKN